MIPGSCTSETPEFRPTINTPKTRSISLRKLAASAFTKGILRAGGETGQNLKALEHLRVATCWFADNPIGSPEVCPTLLKVDEAGAKFKSLTEELDTTTPMGRMVTQVVGRFAEFERSIIRRGPSWVWPVLVQPVGSAAVDTSSPLPNKPRQLR
jgi:hypothetical protein